MNTTAIQMPITTARNARATSTAWQIFAMLVTSMCLRMKLAILTVHVLQHQSIHKPPITTKPQPPTTQIRKASSAYTHKPSPPKTYKASRTSVECFGCTQMFATHSAMLTHLESGNCTVDENDLDLLAEKCYQSRRYVSAEHREWLRTEERSDHRAKGVYNSRARRWECEMCQQSFHTQQGMESHVSSPIHDPFVYECPDCEIPFSTLSALLQHVESQTCDEGIWSGSKSIGKLMKYMRKELLGDA